ADHGRRPHPRAAARAARYGRSCRARGTVHAARGGLRPRRRGGRASPLRRRRPRLGQACHRDRRARAHQRLLAPPCPTVARMTTIVCPVCGTEYESWSTRCLNCGVALVGSDEPIDILSLDESEQVVYELASWPLDLQASAAEAMAEAELSHAWD